MKELRCKKCNKLLAKYSGDIQSKCPRCKTMNEHINSNIEWEMFIKGLEAKILFAKGYL